MEPENSAPSWLAVAVNGSASAPTDIVAAVALDPSGVHMGLLDGRAGRPPLYNVTPSSKLEALAEEGLLSALADPVEVKSPCVALLLSPELNRTLGEHCLEGQSVWPENKGIVRAMLRHEAGGAGVEVGFGPEPVLRAVRSEWANVLLRATNLAGERYALALSGPDRQGEERELEAIRRCADLGAYCAADGEDFPFRVRVGLVQMRRADEIGLRATYEVMVRPSFQDVTWETFLSYVRDLFRLYVENASARRYAESLLHAATSGQYPSSGALETLTHGVIAAPESEVKNDEPATSDHGVTSRP